MCLNPAPLCLAACTHRNYLCKTEVAVSEATASAAVLCLLWTLYLAVVALAGLEADSTVVNKAAAQTRATAVQHRRNRSQAWARAKLSLPPDSNKLAVQDTHQALLTNQRQSNAFKASAKYHKSIIGAKPTSHALCTAWLCSLLV